MLPILIDSNIYILLLRRRLDPVAVLLEHYDTLNLVTCGMVKLEVLRGVREPAVLKNLGDFLDIQQYVSADHRLWSEAVNLVRRTEETGHALQSPDAVIAAAALRKQAIILTHDHDFSHVPGIQTLRLPEGIL